MVDIEFQSASRLKTSQIEKLRSEAAVVLSFHDFRATAKLEETYAKMSAQPADFYKIAPTARTLYDNISLMNFLEKHRDRHALVGMCMGEQGIISRVLGVRAGSAFTFGALNADDKTASGQVTAQDLRSTYDTLREQIGYESQEVDTGGDWLMAGTILVVIGLGAAFALGARLP